MNWKELVTSLNGILRGYCIYFKETEKTYGILPDHNISQMELTITDLIPFTRYYLQVAAKTTPGCGVKSEVNYLTREDGK